MIHEKETLPNTQQERFRIRRATSHDVDTVVEFNAALARDTEGKHLEMARLQQGVEAVLDNEDHGYYFMAEELSSQKAIGQLLITFEWSDWRNAVFWWLQSVYVHPEYRRQGVFRRLYAFVKEEAQMQKTVAGIRLYVEKENRLAQQVYQHMGLLPAGYHVYEVDFVLPTSS